MAAAEQENNEISTIYDKASLIDLTKIPEREFEKQFRNWMERDEVARSLQSKLRYDLITNFNKTNLGKRLMAETTTNRLTLSPMVLALNTLVAEFLYAQDCHFTLSIFCTEVPFRNTLPDFENARHFRFSKTEIADIMTAICGPISSNWSVDKVAKSYTANTTTSLLFFILKALLEKTAESTQQKVNASTNTRPYLKLAEDYSSMSEQQFKNDEQFGNNIRYINKYLIILSKKVKEMTDQIANLQSQRECCIGTKHPRVRFLKFRQRKYEDLNRSLERVTANLKQAASAKRKNKYLDAIVKAIETLAMEFQKCAANFEKVSNNLKQTGFAPKIEKSTSAESLHRTEKAFTSRTTAASQTDMEEKSYADWVYEMRYTRNGQKFLDRIEKSLRKTMEKQKRDLITESEIRLRHHSEILKIRYKQKLIEQMYFQGGENAEPAEDKQDLKASISEQFRQFEMKHFDLLSKIYESEKENFTSLLQVDPNASNSRNVPNQEAEKNTSNMEIESSHESFEHHQNSRQALLPKNTADIQQHIRQTVDDLVEEERNVNQIVNDAKSRIRELEQESNQLSEHFLGYLERQRKQKLEARDAAQSIWNDYINEREKMKERYCFSTINSNIDNTKEFESIKNLILNGAENDCHLDRGAETNNEIPKNSSSDNSSPNLRYTNPISKAKDEFFERERKFKEETERRLYEVSNMGSINADVFNRESKSNDKGFPLDFSFHELSKGSRPLSSKMMSHLLNDPLYETGNDLLTLWSASPHHDILATSATMAIRSSDLSSSTQTAPTITTTAARTATDGQSINSAHALCTEWTQNPSVNNFQRHEVQSTTIPTQASSKSIRQQIHFPTTTATTIATTLNKNNNNVEEQHNFGAWEVQSAQHNHNSRSDFGQKDKGPNENNNNNSKNDGKNYKTERSLSENTLERSGLKKKDPTARNAVLKQSMAKIQQLFNPHQVQRRQRQANQPIKLDHVTEEDEESASVTTIEPEQQSNKKKLVEELMEKFKNATSREIGIENVSSRNKNNFQLQQDTTTTTASATTTATTTATTSTIPTITKTPATTTTTTIITTKMTTKEPFSQLKRNATFIGSIGNGGRPGDINAVNVAANTRKQQQILTTTSSSGGSKAIELMPDWQPIGCGTTRGFSASKEKAKPMKIKMHESAEEEKAIEVMKEKSNVFESGEAIETAERNVAGGKSTFRAVPEAQKQLEYGELHESDSSVRGKMFTAVSSESSSDVQLSVAASDGAGDGASLVRNGIRNRSLKSDVASESDSDFWA